MMPKFEYTHRAEKASDTTVVTALCNQPEAFALDLSDYQSRYLLETATLLQHICGCLATHNLS